MRPRSLGAVLTAVLFLATAAFAQNKDQYQNKNNRNQPNTTATDNQNKNQGQTQGVQGNEATGKVTRYTPGDKITVQTNKGSRDFDLKNAQANVDTNVKVGSRVRVSETNHNGQRTINVEPTGGQRAGTAGAHGRRGRLPKTGSEYPLVGLLGLMSLAAGAGLTAGRKRA